jgi:hypothetical protein
MHLSTLFLSVLLPFSLALPGTKTMSSTIGFIIHNFEAFASADRGRNSSASFIACAENYEFCSLCHVQIKGPLYSDMWHDECDLLMSREETDKMSFRIRENFTTMEMMRIWGNV